jgi:mono/diheme cytochrome c family protein
LQEQIMLKTSMMLVLFAALTACASPQPAPVSAAPMPAEHAGDASRGLAYARTACAGCHAVEAGDMMSPDAGAPPFEELARTPGMTGRALTVWLNSSHEAMPEFRVEPSAVDDLAAYLTALENRPGASAP